MRDKPPTRRTQSSSSRIQSVAKATRVLRAFTLDRPEWTVSGLSQHLSWHKAVVQKILATLWEGGLLQRDSESRRYRLGPGIMELAGVFLSEEPLMHEGAAVVRALVEQTGFTAALAVLDGFDVLYLAAIEGSGLKASARTGERRPAHATASGKVILAELASDQLEARLSSHPLEPVTPHTITDINRLRLELDEVRTLGFAVNIRERHVAAAGVAAPVRDHRGETVAAISLGFAYHLPGNETLDREIRSVIEAANTLSRRLGAPAGRLVPTRPMYLAPVGGR
jgi:IclR family KDG regulon transcriptional repressor